MPRDPSATLYSLQIGRALAALAVVISHAALGANILFPAMPDAYYHLLELGNLGVDYFFVLSGFIIAHATAAMKPDPAHAKRYAISRAIRIYVPYLPIAIALMLIVTLLPSVFSENREPFSIAGSLFLLPSNAKTLLLAAWTLQHEVVFYTLFGICFFWFKNPRLIYLWVIPIVALTFFYAPRWMHAVAGLLNLEFLFGITACYLYQSQQFFAWRYRLVAAGLGIVVFAAAQLFAAPPSFHYHVLAGFGFALIVLGLVYIEADIDFSCFRRMLFLGSASYAIYLMHGPVMSAIGRVYIPSNWQTTLPMVVIISVIASVAYYLLIEKPLIAWSKKRWMK
jgi:peptidoglycan/LPS O-acetylase OafA/YrhL